MRLLRQLGFFFLHILEGPAEPLWPAKHIRSTITIIILIYLLISGGMRDYFLVHYKSLLVNVASVAFSVLQQSVYCGVGRAVFGA